MEDLEFYKARVLELTGRVNTLNQENQVLRLTASSAQAWYKMWRNLYILSALAGWLWFASLSHAFHV